MSEQWPKEREDRLRELWALGLSYSQIGTELGLTRNAIAGKVNRLGLPTRSGKVRVPYTHAIKKRHLIAAKRWRGTAA